MEINYQLLNRVKYLAKSLKDFDAEKSVEDFCNSDLYSSNLSLEQMQKRFLSWYAERQSNIDIVDNMRIERKILEIGRTKK